MQPGRETGSVVHQAVMEQDQVNREQEELDRTQDNLTFSEVLHLLSKKAVLGPGIPPKYDIPPWRLPQTEQHSNQIILHLEGKPREILQGHSTAGCSSQDHLRGNTVPIQIIEDLYQIKMVGL